MNDFTEVRLQLDKDRNLVIALINEDAPDENVVVTVPRHLGEDFCEQVKNICGI